MDDEYIGRVLSGDIDAFRYFLKTHKDMAFNVAVSIIKDDHYAEEIVQDAFLKAFRALKNFNKKAKFKTWFYRIVVNESFKRLRTLKKTIQTDNIESIDDMVQEYPGETLNQTPSDVERAINSLPVNESLALNLFYLEENSLKEVSEITGWSIANTKVILHRARINMRSRLREGSNL